jgi:DnaK suppressor protein
MPAKMTKSPGKASADKTAHVSPRRSIVSRATKAVATTRKAIGKVAGRPVRKTAAKLSASRPVATARRAPATPRATVVRSGAARTQGATKAATRRSPAKKVTGRTIARPVAKKVAVAKKATGARKVAVAKKVTGAKKVVVAKKLTAVKKAAATKTTARKKVGAGKIAAGRKATSARARPRVSTAKGTSKLVAPPARAARHEGAKASARTARRPGTTRPLSARLAPVRVVRQGYTEERFLGHQRNILERERATYVEQANSLQAEAEALVAEMEPGDIQFDEESGEGGTVAVDRERDLTISAQALEAVTEIDAALAKIDRGKYGVCEGCGELIPRLRLEALPYARLCMACKSGGLSRR